MADERQKSAAGAPSVPTTGAKSGETTSDTAPATSAFTPQQGSGPSQKAPGETPPSPSAFASSTTTKQRPPTPTTEPGSGLLNRSLMATQSPYSPASMAGMKQFYGDAASSGSGSGTPSPTAKKATAPPPTQSQVPTTPPAAPSSKQAPASAVKSGTGAPSRAAAPSSASPVPSSSSSSAGQAAGATKPPQTTISSVAATASNNAPKNDAQPRAAPAPLAIPAEPKAPVATRNDRAPAAPRVPPTNDVEPDANVDDARHQPALFSHGAAATLNAAIHSTMQNLAKSTTSPPRSTKISAVASSTLLRSAYLAAARPRSGRSSLTVEVLPDDIDAEERFTATSRRAPRSSDSDHTPHHSSLSPERQYAQRRDPPTPPPSDARSPTSRRHDYDDGRPEPRRYDDHREQRRHHGEAEPATSLPERRAPPPIVFSSALFQTLPEDVDSDSHYLRVLEKIRADEQTERRTTSSGGLLSGGYSESHVSSITRALADAFSPSNHANHQEGAERPSSFTAGAGHGGVETNVDAKSHSSTDGQPSVDAHAPYRTRSSYSREEEDASAHYMTSTSFVDDSGGTNGRTPTSDGAPPHAFSSFFAPTNNGAPSVDPPAASSGPDAAHHQRAPGVMSPEEAEREAALSGLDPDKKQLLMGCINRATEWTKLAVNLLSLLDALKKNDDAFTDDEIAVIKKLALMAEDKAASAMLTYDRMSDIFLVATKRAEVFTKHKQLIDGLGLMKYFSEGNDNIDGACSAILSGKMIEAPSGE